MNTNLFSSNITESAEIEIGDDILGIRGPVDIPSGWEWLWWALGILAIALILYWLTQKFLNRVQFIGPPRIPYIAPHTLARRRLNEAMKLMGDPYRFCTAVSHVIRHYIEGRFSIHAPDRTTDEFLDELRNDSALTPDQQDFVSGFLNQCDLVKFAREIPNQDQLEKMHASALRLVDETMPGVAAESNTQTEEVAR